MGIGLHCAKETRKERSTSHLNDIHSISISLATHIQTVIITHIGILCVSQPSLTWNSSVFGLEMMTAFSSGRRRRVDESSLMEMKLLITPPPPPLCPLIPLPYLLAAEGEIECFSESSIGETNSEMVRH